MQPCQPQEPAQRPPSGRLWDSTDQLSCVAPAEGSGDYLLESLFPEFYTDNNNSFDTDFWGGTMSNTEYGGLGMDHGVGELYGFERGVEDNASFGVDHSGFIEMSTEDATSSGANISPAASPAAPMPSTFTTPASTSNTSKSTKKRPSPDHHSSRTTSPHSDTSSAEPTDKVVKRQRNTEAARRYRQRKVDRVTELEEALAAMTRERDDFKLRLARSEAEVDVLRGLVGKGR